MSEENEPVDVYLDLFSATHEMAVKDDTEIHVVKLRISDEICAEIHLPTEVANEHDKKAVRFMVLERMMGDIMEGVIHALRKVDGDYPTYEEYLLLQEAA